MAKKIANQQNSLWETVLTVIVDQLKGRLFKAALKKLLGTSVGLKAWLVQFAITNLWEEFVEPLIKAGLVEIKYIGHKIEGRLTVEKIEKARKSGNAEEYNTAVDSAFD